MFLKYAFHDWSATVKPLICKYEYICCVIPANDNMDDLMKNGGKFDMTFNAFHAAVR